jgi:protein ImuA
MLSKTDTFRRLQAEILSLQGFRPANATVQSDFGLGPIASSLPDQAFPSSALHEFICESLPEVAASSAFVTGLLSTLLQKGGVVLWISTRHLVFPPALKAFGISPDQIIFINVRKEKEAIWTIEEALKSMALTSVVGEISRFHFTDSRRLQLAIEQSGVGCFLLCYRPRNLTTASTTRWQITPLSSTTEDNLPGVGQPRWKVNLLKVRGGKPGSWTIEWAQGRFRHTSKLVAVPGELRNKTA